MVKGEEKRGGRVCNGVPTIVKQKSIRVFFGQR